MTEKLAPSARGPVLVMISGLSLVFAAGTSPNQPLK